MKKVVLLMIMGVFLLSMDAQVKTPRPSPFSKLEQTVGLTDIHIEYSRPGVKARKIYGSLVPFNEYWRTGANRGTKVTFTEDVVFNGEDVKKGTYTLFTKPGPDRWEIVLYDDLEINVPPKEIESEKVISRTNVTPWETTRMYETMTFEIGDIRDDNALIHLLWERTGVSIPIQVHTDDQVIATIEDAMDGPDAGEYRNAANYYLNTDRDLDQALTWINKSLELSPGKFWVLRDKSKIQAALGDYSGAIETAKTSMAAAQEAGNMQYVKFNEKAIEDWTIKQQMKR